MQKLIRQRINSIKEQNMQDYEFVFKSQSNNKDK